MKRILLAISFVVLAATATKAQYDTWQTLGSPDFSNGISSEPIVKVHNNTTYVAYSDASLGYKAVVKYYDGTDWVNLGDPQGVSDGQAVYLDFEFSAAGVPHIAYRDNSQSGGGDARVKYFDGTNWVNLGGLVSPAGITHTDLAFDGNDVYVGYIEAWNLQELTVQKFDGTNWNVVGNQSFSPMFCTEFELNIDVANQYAWASFRVSNSASLMRLDLSDANATWANVSSNFTPSGSGYYHVIFYNGTPYISYVDDNNQSAISVKAFNWQTGVWDFVGNDAFTDEQVNYYDFRLSSSGTPHVLFNSNSNPKATMLQFDGTDWVEVGSSYFTPNTIDDALSFDFLSNGNPVVVYVNKGNTDELSAMTLLPCSQTSSTETVSACESYISPSENYVWNTSGTYMDTIPNVLNCDSVITVNLTITIDTTVNQIDQNLSSNSTAPNTTYQWIDCSDNSPIPGATSQQYEATALGEYAVIISNGNCTDTSACYEVTGFTNLEELISGLVKVYPNPAENIVNIEVSKWLDVDAMKIVKLQGQTMKRFNGLTNQVDVSELSAGTYFLIISSEGKSIHKKITKQ